MTTDSNTVDVVIIGAGISGINAGYRVQTGLPNSSYVILEGRHEIGGTWSLFKYPGIRSDSDLFTFGFPWDPWAEDRAIASAPSILSYMKNTAAKHGIDKHIRFNSHVSALNWKSDQQRWHITVNADSEKPQTYYARWVIKGTGYYDYREPLEADIPGLKSFEGNVIHPQFWPEDYDYSDKRVIIIGSGATAVTLLPSMAPAAKSVTMLQRSPSYFFAPPEIEAANMAIKRWFPAWWAHRIMRWRMLVLTYFFFNICRLFPGLARKFLIKGVERQLPPGQKTDPDFNPRYDPWHQRMCITPGGDFFKALRGGKAHVVTDTIDTVTPTGIKLSSGRELPADVIVTATGLKLNLDAHAQLCVDGTRIRTGNKFVWKGALLQDVPNFAFIFGYTNASWTLGADATAQLFVRLIKAADERGATSVTPHLDETTSHTVKSVPALNLSSTYIAKAAERGDLPKVGDSGPWVPRSNYFRDYWNSRWGDLSNGLQFNRVAVE
ncbi:hypothetical protein DV737_g407, partial [Chaetothyriales sp. CBS 132003]